jgi:hypothetical protein
MIPVCSGADMLIRYTYHDIISRVNQGIRPATNWQTGAFHLAAMNIVHYLTIIHIDCQIFLGALFELVSEEETTRGFKMKPSYRKPGSPLWGELPTRWYLALYNSRGNRNQNASAARALALIHRLFAKNDFLGNIYETSRTRLEFYRLTATIELACATFHAPVGVGARTLSFGRQRVALLRADLYTVAATDAFCRIN